MTRLRSILLITHFYPPEVGAPQRRLRAFVKRWRERGLHVRVITSLPHYPSGRMAAHHSARLLIGTSVGEFGETVVRVPFLPKASPDGAVKMLDHFVVALSSLPPALVGPRPDVVLSTVLSLPSIAAGRVAAARWDVPFVIEMRDAWPDLLFKSGYKAGVTTRTLAAAVTRAQRNADRVVTVTEGFRDVLVTRGVASTRVRHISNGIDVDEVPSVPHEPTTGRLKVLYLGTHGVSQDLETAVRGIAAAKPPVEARFIGDGAEKSRMKHLALDLGAPVSFEDPVEGDQLWDAYRWADTCLVPLQPWDAFRHTVPSKVYELMAASCHMTCLLHGEAASIVRSAGAGIVVPPGDSVALGRVLSELGQDKSLLAVGRSPRDWVRQHASYRVLADDYVDMFNEVCS